MKRFPPQGWSVFELLWGGFCISSIAALSLWWGESALAFSAAVTGMIYTLLAGKAKVSCFFFGMVNAPLYAFLSWREGYYGDMALNIYYFAMMFSGLAAWRRNLESGETGTAVRRSLGFRGRVMWAAGLLAATVPLWAVLSICGGRDPLSDALTNVFSVAAMVLTVKRCVEQWILWIAVDLVEVFMWWRVWAESGNSVSVLLMWLLFFVNGLYLWRLWSLEMRKRQRGA
jgi:nicotinamide mononucleotide transporter